MQTDLAMFGLNQEQIGAIRGVLSSYPNIERAVIFGSRAKGSHRNGSDIDLALVGSGLEFQDLLSLNSKLDALNLPWRFDTLILDNVHDLKVVDHIHRMGKVFYERSIVPVMP